MTRLGFVGAGRMGAPMVSRLVAAGHEVRVLVRSEDRRADVAAAGGRPVADLAAVGDSAEAVIVCVFTDEQVREVCLDSPLLDAMPRGSVLVVHTTVAPRTIEDLEAAAARHGVAVVDAAVSGGPHDVAAGRLTLFLGGADEAVHRIRPLLAGYGNPILHVGPAGGGQRVKLVNNALFAAQIGLLTEAVRLGAQLGVDETSLLAALPHASSASRVMGNVAARGSVASFTEAIGTFLSKDVAVVRATVAELGGDLGVLDAAIDVQQGPTLSAESSRAR